MDNNEISNQDILSAINVFADKTEQRFDKIESDVSELKHDVSDLKTDVTEIRSKMVTKEYLDDKLADLRGDLVVLMRKEDTKLKTLVEILCQRNVISKEEMNQVISREPFPQIMV
ncbi:MAG: hypothetical protein V1928_04450 [Parcubacteria group bacterium]